jgi:hypothetical protein
MSFVVIEHGIFAIPVLVLFVLLQRLPLNFFLILFVIFSGLGIPFSAGMAYMIAKGSNWINTRTSVIALGVFPGQIYGFLFGGSVGYYIWNSAGGVVGAIICFVLGSMAGARIAQYLLNRELPA